MFRKLPRRAFRKYGCDFLGMMPTKNVTFTSHLPTSWDIKWVPQKNVFFVFDSTWVGIDSVSFNNLKLLSNRFRGAIVYVSNE